MELQTTMLGLGERAGVRSRVHGQVLGGEVAGVQYEGRGPGGRRW